MIGIVSSIEMVNLCQIMLDMLNPSHWMVKWLKQ